MDCKPSDEYTFLFIRSGVHRNLTNTRKKAENMMIADLLMAPKFCIYSCGF